MSTSMGTVDPELQQITQKIYMNILDTCSCSFALAKQKFQCSSLDQSQVDQTSVIFQVHIISTQNETTTVQRHLKEWISGQHSIIMVDGVRLHLESVCQPIAIIANTFGFSSSEVLSDCTVSNMSTVLHNNTNQTLIVLLGIFVVLLALATIGLAIALGITYSKMKTSHSTVM